jgi:hypothetical protein
MGEIKPPGDDAGLSTNGSSLVGAHLGLIIGKQKPY